MNMDITVESGHATDVRWVQRREGGTRRCYFIEATKYQPRPYSRLRAKLLYV
jgi:hypothetical protein